MPEDEEIDEQLSWNWRFLEQVAEEEFTRGIHHLVFAHLALEQFAALMAGGPCVDLAAKLEARFAAMRLENADQLMARLRAMAAAFAAALDEGQLVYDHRIVTDDADRAAAQAAIVAADRAAIRAAIQADILAKAKKYYANCRQNAENAKGGSLLTDDERALVLEFIRQQTKTRSAVVSDACKWARTALGEGRFPGINRRVVIETNTLQHHWSDHTKL